MSMNNKIAGFLMFATGAVVGSIATWKFIKTKYERIADEEIKSIKEIYSKKETATKVKQLQQEDTEAVTNMPSIYETKKYLETIKENGYHKEENKDEGDPDMNDSPYVISPEEFGNRDDHTCVSLSYYADGVLADDWDTVVLDPIEEVGPDVASHFGEYEEDTVFIRNEKRKVDYEICRDLRTFAEVMGDEAIDQSDD